MATGSGSFKWVAAIEGYQYLLTDATTAQAVTAWAGTNHSAALGGLYARCNLDQSINPWDPFENGGGRLTLQVVQTSTADTLGVDTHLKRGGFETLLTVARDCDDTTFTVKSTATFPSSGTLYIGTEACSYSGVTATTFTGLSRGLYAPFDRGAGTGFAHPHEVATDGPTSVQLLPVVSSTPRSWHGRWVGLWRHLYTAATAALNVKDDALLTFAGRIVEVRDNAATLTTDVEVEHVLEYIKRAVLGDTQWTGTIVDGIGLGVGNEFRYTERDDGVAVIPRSASPLVVVASAASGAYEVNAGRYTIFEICDKISNWLAQAEIDADIEMKISCGITGIAWNVPRGQLIATTPSIGTGDTISFKISFPNQVGRALGGFPGETLDGVDAASNLLFESGPQINGTERYKSVRVPLRNSGELVAIINESGTFWPQLSSLPGVLQALKDPDVTGDSGVCLLYGLREKPTPCFVVKDGDELVQCTPFDETTGLKLDPPEIEIPINAPGESSLKQIYMISGTFADVIKWIFISTGTAGNNHATYDVLPASLSLAIPFDMLGTNFLTSIDQLAHSDVGFTLIIDKPKKLEDAIGGALGLRFAFLRWIDGGVQFWSWMTPTTGDLLEEANKASPAGNQDEQRSVSVLSDKWARNVVKVEYDKDFILNDSGGAGTYHSSETIIDRSAIDGAGGAKRVQTIADQSSYSQWFLGGAGGTQAVLPYFREIVPMFTRPVRTTRRTIDPRFFEGYSVGDCVLVTDAFARDPDTGLRGVSVRPGIIVSHSYEPGGFDPTGAVSDMHGEVEIMFLDLLRVGPYVPCADVDSSQANGGLDAGTSTIFTCYAHSYSVSGEAADASYMSAGRKIRIIERDPEDPAAPLSWDRVVQSQTGNTVTVTVAISSPAWDSSKNYRIVWDDYGDAIAAQQLYAYQADDADGRIADTRAPYQYTTNTTLKDIDSTAGDANAATDGVELPPSASHGDGVGLDVGHHTALNRLINNLLDYKTARSSPFLVRTVFEVDGTGDFPELDVWKMRAVMPIFLTGDGLSTTVARYLYVAPHWRSSTGSSVSMRITLAREMPTVTNTDGSHIIGPDNYGQVTFTIASSTYATPTAQGISIGTIKDSGGVAYVLIEMFIPTASSGAKAQCYGLGTCYEGPRA